MAERALTGTSAESSDDPAVRARARARRRRLLLLARGGLSRLPPSKMVWLQVAILFGRVSMSTSAHLARAMLRRWVVAPVRRWVVAPVRRSAPAPRPAIA